MTVTEKRLYHQLHPIKLFVDLSTAFGSIFLLWKHLLIESFLLAFIPSIMVSFALMKYVDLELYGSSAAGRYLRTYLNSRAVDGLRFSGFFVMLIGGWYHDLRLIVFGICVIAACWSYGLLIHLIRKIIAGF
jgi:hypothetical protein